MPANNLWAPYQPENMADPYPMYARLRHEAPVFQSQTGEWVVSRYDDVRSVLKDTSFKSGNRLDWLARGISYLQNRDQDLSDIYKAINNFLLFLNPPDHLPMRNLIMRLWDNHEVNELIRNEADEQLRHLPGEFDLVADYAQQVPSKVICRIMGIDPNDHSYLRETGLTMVRSLDLYQTWKQLVELNDASRKFVSYFTEFVNKKRSQPDGALASRLIAASDRERLLREEQLVSLLIFLYLAGEETTAVSIGLALRHLIASPDHYQQFRREKEIRSQAIQELFRFDSPVHVLGRLATADTVIGNTAVPKGAPITLVIASGNRDESRFSNADRIEFQRPDNRHLTFGHGTHYCMGEWLAAAQTEIAVGRFVDRFGTAYLRTQTVEWNNNLAVRGMKSLLISAHP